MRRGSGLVAFLCRVFGFGGTMWILTFIDRYSDLILPVLILTAVVIAFWLGAVLF